MRKPQLDPALISRLEQRLGPCAGEPVVLDGGITNRNYRATFGGRDVVVRLCSPGTEILGVDRDTEVFASQRAAELGIGPEVLGYLPADGILICAFLDGEQLDKAAVRGRLAQIALALRGYHDTAPLPTAFDVFEVIERQRAVARGLPDDYDALHATSERIHAAVGDQQLVPSHNDLLAGNFIGYKRSVRIVDWEYAGNDLRMFDLGNLATNNELTDADEEELLTAYFDDVPTAAQRAELKLMRFMSDFREAMWGATQAAVSDLDEDFDAYAAQHFARLRAAAAHPDFEQWIRDAAAA